MSLPHGLRRCLSASVVLRAIVLLVALAVVVTIAAPNAKATHQVTVTVTVTNVDNLVSGQIFRCFDPQFLGCGRGDFFAIISFTTPNGPSASCDATSFTEDRDFVEPNWTCTRTVNAPATAMIDIWDFDGGLRGLDGHDPADAVAGPGRILSIPVSPGTTPFDSTGDDVRVRGSVTAAVVPASLTSVSVTPTFFDPSLGESARVLGGVSEFTPLTLEILNPSGALVHQSTSMTFSAASGTYEFTWDGRVNGVPAPGGTYTARVSGGAATSPAARTATFFVVRRPPNTLAILSLAPAADWNVRSGALDVSFTLSSAGSASMRIFPGGICTGVILRTIAPQQFGAGVSTLRWDGRDSSGNFVAPGTYGVSVSATGPTGGPTSPSSTCTPITTIPPPALELIAEHSPLVAVTGDTVTIVARALDAQHRERRTAMLEIWVATPGQVTAGTPPTAPAFTCSRSDSCTLTRADLTSAVGRLAVKAVASDDDGPRAETPWRLFDVANSTVFTGPGGVWRLMSSPNRSGSRDRRSARSTRCSTQRRRTRSRPPPDRLPS